MTLLHILASSKGGEGKGGDFFIYIYIYISSFKLLIVRLDYQNHSVALPAAGRPPPWFPATASCSPSSQLCSPQEGPVGPIAQHCPMEGSGSVPGPHKHQPPDHLGLVITMFSPCCPHHALLPSSGRRKPKDLEVGAGEGFILSPPPSPHTPYSPAQRDAAHTRKDY